MKRQAFIVVVAVAAALASAIGCKKKEPEQPPMPPPTTYPTATAPVATGGVAPMPLSPACQQPEGTCGWARCNMTAGRCAFPCNGDAECIQGARCIGAGTALAVCAPASVPGMTPAPAPQPTMLAARRAGCAARRSRYRPEAAPQGGPSAPQFAL